MSNRDRDGMLLKRYVLKYNFGREVVVLVFYTVLAAT